MIADIITLYTEHPATMGTFTLVVGLIVVVIVGLVKSRE